jgi:hypothetical protein
MTLSSLPVLQGIPQEPGCIVNANIPLWSIRGQKLRLAPGFLVTRQATLYNLRPSYRGPAAGRPDSAKISGEE